MAWQEHFIDLNGYKLHYTRTGGDKPPFVIVHGFTDNGISFRRLAENLSADYDVILPDARGHGQSDRLKTEISITDLAKDVLSLIDALGLEKPIVLGHSMGAATTALAASLDVGKFGRIILEDPPWNMTPTGDRDRAKDPKWQEWRDWQIACVDRSIEDLVAERHSTDPNWHAVDKYEWAVSKQQIDIRIFDWLKWSDAPAWHSAIQTITCPILLIKGETERGGLVSPEVAAHAQSLMPNVQVEHFAHSGHQMQRDEFDKFVAVVREFSNL